MAMGCILAGHWLAIGWPLAGYKQAMAKNQYTSRQSFTIMYQSLTWLQAILWTAVCVRLFLAIGWLLAVPGCLKINTLQDIHVVINHYVPKWHMAAINTLDCIVFTRFFWLSAGYQLAIGWLLAGYVPKSIHLKI